MVRSKEMLKLLLLVGASLAVCNCDSIFNIQDAIYVQHSRSDDGTYQMTPGTAFPFFGQNVQNFYVSFFFFFQFLRLFF